MSEELLPWQPAAIGTEIAPWQEVDISRLPAKSVYEHNIDWYLQIYVISSACSTRRHRGEGGWFLSDCYIWITREEKVSYVKQSPINQASGWNMLYAFGNMGYVDSYCLAYRNDKLNNDEVFAHRFRFQFPMFDMRVFVEISRLGCAQIAHAWSDSCCQTHCWNWGCSFKPFDIWCKSWGDSDDVLCQRGLKLLSHVAKNRLTRCSF